MLLEAVSQTVALHFVQNKLLTTDFQLKQFGQKPFVVVNKEGGLNVNLMSDGFIASSIRCLNTNKTIDIVWSVLYVTHICGSIPIDNLFDLNLNI